MFVKSEQSPCISNISNIAVSSSADDRVRGELKIGNISKPFQLKSQPNNARLLHED